MREYHRILGRQISVLTLTLTWLLLTACSDTSAPQSKQAQAADLAKIGAALQIQNPQTQQQLYDLLTQAQQQANAGILTDDQLDLAGSLLSQAQAGQNDNFDQTMEQIGKAENDRLQAVAHSEQLIFQAAAMVEKQAGLSPYQAKKKTVSYFRTTYPKKQGTFVLSQDIKLAYPADLEPCPKVGEKYVHLLGGEAKKFDFYSKDPVYRELLETPDDQLPDDAVLAVAFLALQNRDASLERDSYTANESARVMLPRFGERAIPAILQILSDPERYGQEPSQRLSDPRPTFDSLGKRYARIVADIPGQETEPFYRAALEAGWNGVTSELPEAEWSRKLLDDFQDSPFGRPYRPRWSRK